MPEAAVSSGRRVLDSELGYCLHAVCRASDTRALVLSPGGSGEKEAGGAEGVTVSKGTCSPARVHPGAIGKLKLVPGSGSLDKGWGKEVADVGAF